jgi:hypothetical protein
MNIYTYWNLDSVRTALNGVALLVGGADWLGLMQSIVLVGLLISATVGLTKFRVVEPLMHIGMLALIYGVMFVPKVTVGIVDVRSNTATSVSNVPLGLAFFASTTSHIGKFLTDKFETMFTGPDSLKFSRTGLGWGANAQAALTGQMSSDPMTMEIARNVVRACINPEISEYPHKYKELLESNNMMQTILQPLWINGGRVVNIPSTDPNFPYTFVGCTTGVTTLRDRLNITEPQRMTGLARVLLKDTPPATANGLIGSYLASSEGIMLNASRSAADMIRQATMVNLMNDSAGSLAIARGDPSAAQVATGLALARQQTIGSNRVMAQLGAEALPKIRNIAEALLIATFPIVILMMLAAGAAAGAPLKAYVMSCAWVQLWAPLYALVNALYTPLSASRLTAALDGAANQTLANSDALLNAALTEQNMAGALVMMVPALAYALVKGGEAGFNSAMSAMTSGASSAASRQGGETAIGNTSFGNASWGNASMNNMGANKWDTNTGFASGRTSLGSGLTGANYGTSGSGVADASGADAQLAGGGLNWSTALQNTAANAAGRLMTASREFGQRAATTMSAVSGISGSTTRSSGGGTSVGTTSTFGQDGSFERLMGKAFEGQSQYTAQSGFSNAEKFVLAAGIGGDAGGKGSGSPGGGGGGGGAKGGGKAGWVGAIGALLQARGMKEWQAGAEAVYQDALKASQTDGFKSAASVVNKGSTGTTGSTESAADNRTARAIQAATDQTKQHVASSNSAMQQADTIGQSAQTIASQGAGGQASLNRAYQNWLGGANGVAAEAQLQPAQQAALRQAFMNAFVASQGGEAPSGMGGMPSSGSAGNAGAGGGMALLQAAQGGASPGEILGGSGGGKLLGVGVGNGELTKAERAFDAAGANAPTHTPGSVAAEGNAAVGQFNPSSQASLNGMTASDVQNYANSVIGSAGTKVNEGQAAAMLAYANAKDGQADIQKYLDGNTAPLLNRVASMMGNQEGNGPHQMAQYLARRAKGNEGETMNGAP